MLPFRACRSIAQYSSYKKLGCSLSSRFSSRKFSIVPDRMSLFFFLLSLSYLQILILLLLFHSRLTPLSLHPPHFPPQSLKGEVEERNEGDEERYKRRRE